MNKTKNIMIVASLLSAIVVSLENIYAIFGTMDHSDAYTLFVLLRSIVVFGTAYVAYLCFIENKKGWFWTMGLTSLWLNASLSGGSLSIIPMILNLVAFVVLVISLFKLRLSSQENNNVV